MWKFGEAALEETERFAALARRVATLVLQMETPSHVVAELNAALARAEAALAALAPASSRPRIGPDVDGDGRVYLDHARDVGRFDPAFPVYTLDLDGSRASGTVNFPLLYEGPPGLVHGGFLALFFDMVIQQHNCDLGEAGKTTNLDVRYRSTTPLDTDLRFEIERTSDGRRIESNARLSCGETLCVEATLRAVAGKRDNLPAVSPRRAR